MKKTVRMKWGVGLAVLAVCALGSSGCTGPSAISRGESLFSPAKQKAAVAAMGKELWSTPLKGTGIVEDLVRLPDGKLLVALRQYGFTMPIRECLLVDGSNGKVLWKHERGGFPGIWSLLVALPDRLVFHVDGKDHASVVVLDAGTGAERWTHKSPRGTLVRPVLDAGILVTLEPAKQSTLISGYDLASGAQRWKREIPVALDSAPAPILLSQGLILFFGGAELLNASTGASEWKREKITLDAQAAPPILTGDGVWAITHGNELVLFNPLTGDPASSFPLPAGVRITNIYPLGQRLLLRGVEKGENLTIEMGRKSGKPLWIFRDTEPSISNLVDDGGNLFFATPTSVVALDWQGRQLFKTKVTELGQDFPVNIRKVGDKVVFVGEMVVAAFDAATGQQAWWDGIDPIHQDADTDALKKGIDRAESGAASFGGGGGRGYQSDLSRQYQAEASSARFQNLAADSSRRASELSANLDRRSPDLSQNARRTERMGVTIERSSAANAISGDIAITRMNAAFDRTMSMMNFQFAMMDLGKQLNEWANRFYHEERRDYYLFIQRGIFQAYQFSETQGYVLRPSRKGEVVGVTAIELATGKRQFTPYGPQHELFGLWNLPDEDKGVVIHEALRPDPEVPADERGDRPFVNYLMATPVAWPK